MESRDSSSPIITRAVAAALQGQEFETYSFTRWERTALRLFGILPKEAAFRIIPKIQALNAISPRSVFELPVERLALERVNDYSRIRGKFPVITCGIGIGGAAAHLAVSLGGPFLPQAFVLTLKGGSPSGDPKRYFERSKELARSITNANPGVMTIQHFDPVHDGWLTQEVNHLRIKLTSLPESYRRFFRERLEPGGTVCYLQGNAQWPRYRVGERNVFQVGGWGDISAEEYLEGSERLETFARKTGLKQAGWKLDGYPLEEGPESEWGSEPGLGEELETFCRQEGFRFQRICFHHPEQFSELAFWATWKWIRQSGGEPAGTVIETFTQFDPVAVVRASMLPIWLIFNTMDSARYLDEMLGFIPRDKPVFFSALATFSPTPDLVPWPVWERILAGMDWTNIGACASHYPADTRALVDWKEPLKKWLTQHPKPIQGKLSIDDIAGLAREIQKGENPVI